MRTINVALLGFGTVGRGAYDVLNSDSRVIEKNYGLKVKVKKILEINENAIKASGLPKKLFTGDYNEILKDDSIAIVAEMMGGLEPAHTFMMQALKAGKSVVSSNKAAIAAFLPELKKTAKKNKVMLNYEASVCGAIPVLTSIKDNLLVNEFVEIRGIVNGTSNFILTQMAENNMEYAAALKLAQDLGFAEKDPTADVEGIDSANKICILADLAMDHYEAPMEIKRKGITKLSMADLEDAKKKGCKIKLIAKAVATDKGVKLSVKPELVDEYDYLYDVDYEFNGISLKTKYADEIFLSGRGAGSLPTGSAIAGDILNIAVRL